MPVPNPPPPPPTFLVYIYFMLFYSILLATKLDDLLCVIPPPPIFLNQNVNLLIMIFTILQTQGGYSRTLMRLLFPNFNGYRNNGRDVWHQLEMNPIRFWYSTGETPETLQAIVNRTYMDVTAPRHHPRTPRTNRRRRCILDVRNRILLVFVWLRQYLKLRVLAYIFQISKSTVQEEIYHIVPILFLNYRHYITWHNVQKWRQFLNTYPRFPNVVGMIDGTIHRINRPSGREQARFYRGDKKCHFISSQVVVDPSGLIVMLVSGYVLFII